MKATALSSLCSCSPRGSTPITSNIRKGDYVNKLFDIINWDNVAMSFDMAPHRSAYG